MTQPRPTRWIYLDQSSPEESAFYQETIKKIDAWWSAFAASTGEIDAVFRGKSQWDLPAFMHEHLHAIHPQLMWEYGPAVKGEGHRLVITPEGAYHLRPLTRTILERAPKLEGWEFYDARVPESLKEMQMTVEGRTGHSMPPTQVLARIGDFNRVDMRFYSESTPSEEDDHSRHQAFVAIETLLGEMCLDRWIGRISVAPLDDKVKTESLVPLEGFKERVDALIGSIRDQLPTTPYHERIDEASWTLYQFRPEQQTDYPRQADLFVKGTCDQPLLEALSSGISFYSERFSACRETFCYVKMDGTEGLDESEFADRADIETALNEVLKPDGIGCYIGGGTGLRYSYIDLALTNVDEGIKRIRQRLQDGVLPNRAWILFFDADLVGEWVGIYDDTPPPPMETLE